MATVKKTFSAVGLVATVTMVCASNLNLRTDMQQFRTESKTQVGDAAGIMRRWNAFETSQRTTDLRGRRASCDEDAYFESIDTSGVDMNALQIYMEECDEFFSNFENLILNGSVCTEPCLQPSLEFFQLAASGTGGGNCTEFQSALRLAKSLFEDVTCPINENGQRCGDVLTQIDSDIYDPPQCTAINTIGCCYNKLLDILDNPTFQSLTGVSLPVNDTILDSAQQIIRTNCGSSFPNVFSSSCATATPGNGIAESNIKSGISAGSYLVPSVAALSVSLVLSFTAFFA